MTHPDAQRWNKRYTLEGLAKIGRPPSRLLRDFAHLLPPSGLAFEAACGVGNHGLYLAQHGLRVVAMDISYTAVCMAMEQARLRNLAFAAAIWDLASPWLPQSHFDLIANFRFLERATFSVYPKALKPGGLLFFETFLGDPPPAEHPEFYLYPGELLAAFEGLEIIHHHIQKASERRTLEQLVARRRRSAASR